MKRIIKYIICLIIILISNGSLCAKDKYVVTVLPFTLNSSENIEYVKQGIQDMLITRITVPEKINVYGKDTVAEELKKSNIKAISLNDVYKIGKKLKSDYVVWGSITKIGSSISVDGKLVDITNAKSDVGFFTQSPNMDEVIPKVNDFSQRIVQHIIGTSMPKTAVVEPPQASSATSSSLAPGVSRESLIISGMKSGKRGTLTSVINTDFINAPADPFKRKGFWMSQQFPTEFKGMDIGDVNGDGKNEVVTIDDHNVYIYQKTSTEFKLLETIKGKPYDKYLSVDVADIKKSGINQIYVTSVNDTNLDSFVLEYKDGKYEKIADLKWFLRVIDTPSGIPLLLCQAYGFGQIFDTPIYEMIWRNGKFIQDQEMKIPRGLSVYGLAIDNFGTGGTDDKVIALDSLDHICIFRQTKKPLSLIFTFGFKNDDLIWRGDEEFGGSNNYIENVTDKKNFERDSYTKTAFVNLRILTYDLNKSGKKQLIIVKNLSSTGRLLKNLKLFTSSEIYNLEWDGLGMSENWRTKKINGYVADYVFKDIDNDGKPELVLALVLSVGTSVRDKSVIVVYKLDDINQ